MCLYIVLVTTLNLLKLVKLKPLNKSTLRQFAGPTFFYSLNGVLSLAALGQMNLTMYR